MITIDLQGATESLEAGLALIADDLNLQLSHDGQPVTVEQGDHLAVEIARDKRHIVYGRKVEFFRALCLLMVHFDEEAFVLHERAAFVSNGVMLDCSRNAVLELPAIKFFLRKMALMGLNRAMLYTEDTFQMEAYPYFGYGRGRYTFAELKEVDDYADALGIEMMPCIQTLSHLSTVLRWPAAAHLKDTDRTLLVDSDDTYTFIEAMLKAASAPYRSNRIHIGMDEASDMGTGAYQRRFGLVERPVLMARHLKRVNQIVRNLGLRAMMWSDMHIVNMTKQPLLAGYYPTDLETISAQILDSAPDDVDLVYWDYYHEDEAVYDRQLSLHKQFKAETIFAGGVWTWSGPAADYRKTIATTVPALAQCKKHGIRHVFATIWGDDGGETNLLTCLYGLQLFAELDYTGRYDPAELATRFRQSVGQDPEAFLDLARFNNIPGLRFSFQNANPSKMILLEDPLLPLYAQDFLDLDLRAHYSDLVALYQTHRRKNGAMAQLWDFYVKFAAALVLKCEWRDAAAACVRSQDRVRARAMVAVAQENAGALESLRQAWQQLWFSTNKPYGHEVIDLRMGGIIGRFQSAAARMAAFAAGDIADIPELSAEKLPNARKADGELRLVNRWGQFVTPGRYQHDD